MLTVHALYGVALQHFLTQGPLPGHRAIAILKERGYVKGGQQLALVQSGRKPIWRQASTHHIQVSFMPVPVNEC